MGEAVRGVRRGVPRGTRGAGASHGGQAEGRHNRGSSGDGREGRGDAVELGRGAERAGGAVPRAGGRIGGSDAVEQHGAEGQRGLLGDEPSGKISAVRRAGARHGRDL